MLFTREILLNTEHTNRAMCTVITLRWEIVLSSVDFSKFQHSFTHTLDIY